MKLIFASNNLHKLEEIRKILPITIYGLSDINFKIDIEEHGNSFRENALIKATTIAKLCRLPALADDSGLEVDALNGAPGIRSARFAGEKADSMANNKLLLEKLKGVPIEKRGARFRCVLALADTNSQEHCWEGTCEGLIGFEEKGNTGFGYDPLFIIPQYQKTLAELGPEIKNKISHRAQAMDHARPYLLDWIAKSK